VAKILVADDNSNVQKTVTLALVELGVEVVAVNNGDAAVRKLADFSPDLILADIFMPVRNGYEVCEYVKKDARFSQVPVVLLVGAFDPLDEREAQRVGADGILKKPFVPPDPLITMVKTLLDRTLSERLVAAAASKPAVTVQAKAGGAATVEKRSSTTTAEITEEVPEETFSPPPIDRMSFGEGNHPIAFGQLLDAPAKDSLPAEAEAVEAVNDDQILTSARDAALGDPIFWKTEEPAKDSEEENTEAEEGAENSAEMPMRPWKLDEEEIKHRVNEDALPPIDPFELVREGNELEAEQSPAIVAATHSILQDPAAQAALTVQAGKLPDLAENPIEWMASVPAPSSELEPIAPAALEANEFKIAEVPASGNVSGLIDTDQGQSGQEAPAVQPSDLASTEIAAPAIAAVTIPEPAAAAENTPQALKLLTQNVVEESAPQAVKVDWADLSASLQAEPIESATDKAIQPAPAAYEHHTVESAPVSPSTILNSAPAAPVQVAPSAEDTALSLPKRDWADLSAALTQNPGANTAPTLQEHAPSVQDLGAQTSATHAPVASGTATSAHPELTPSPQPLALTTTEKPEETAHSLPKHDWADMTATLEPITEEPVSVKEELLSVSATPPIAASPAAPSAEANTQLSSTISVPQFAKPSTQAPDETAVSLPVKRDWADMTATLEPMGLADIAKTEAHNTIPPATPTPAETDTNVAPPSPSGNAAPPAPAPRVQGPEDTTHSVPKHEWSDLAKGFAPRPAPPSTERPKPAPGILAHGPVVPAAHTQQPSIQAPTSTAVNTRPAAPTAPASQVPVAQISGASALQAPSGQPDPALVEAVVQRVLDKMRPQVVDIITKEFLRPVVQALVHREITKR
jgi:CheY-like chemotaxis protein